MMSVEPAWSVLVSFVVVVVGGVVLVAFFC